MPLNISQHPGVTKNTSPTLRAALLTLPRFTAHEEALAAVTAALRAPRPAPVPTRGDRADALTDRLLADPVLPDTLDEDLRADTTAALAEQTRREVLEDTHQRLNSALDSIVFTGADRLLRHLDGQLRDVIAAARRIDLKGATNAAEAIREGAAEEWAALDGHQHTALVVWAAQHAVHVSVVRDHEYDQRARVFGRIRNAGQVWPEWFDSYRGVYVGSPTTTFEYPEAPWPTNDEDFFLWMVTHPEVEPWVPTPAQAREAYQAAREVVRRAARTPDQVLADERAQERARQQAQRLPMNMRQWASPAPAA